MSLLHVVTPLARHQRNQPSGGTGLTRRGLLKNGSGLSPAHLSKALQLKLIPSQRLLFLIASEVGPPPQPEEKGHDSDGTLPQWYVIRDRSFESAIGRVAHTLSSNSFILIVSLILILKYAYCTYGAIRKVFEKSCYFWMNNAYVFLVGGGTPARFDVAEASTF